MTLLIISTIRHMLSNYREHCCWFRDQGLPAFKSFCGFNPVSWERLSHLNILLLFHFWDLTTLLHKFLSHFLPGESPTLWFSHWEWLALPFLFLKFYLHSKFPPFPVPLPRVHHPSTPSLLLRGCFPTNTPGPFAHPHTSPSFSCVWDFSSFSNSTPSFSSCAANCYFFRKKREEWTLLFSHFLHFFDSQLLHCSP